MSALLIQITIVIILLTEFCMRMLKIKIVKKSVAVESAIKHMKEFVAYSLRSIAIVLILIFDGSADEDFRSFLATSLLSSGALSKMLAMRPKRLGKAGKMIISMFFSLMLFHKLLKKYVNTKTYLIRSKNMLSNK